MIILREDSYLGNNIEEDYQTSLKGQNSFIYQKLNLKLIQVIKKQKLLVNNLLIY